MFAVLRSALRDAPSLDLIPRDPTRAVSQPPAKKHGRPFLSQEEARRLLAVCDGRPLGALFSVAMALGLKWAAVDFVNRSLAVRTTLYRVNGAFAFGEPKSDASRRVLELPDAALQVLVRHRRLQAQQREAAGNEWQDYDLVFATPFGTPLDHSNVTKEFKRTLKAAALPNMRLHDLRHSCASLLVAQGVHMKVVQDVMGHSQISVTADTYAHVARPSRQDAAAKLDEVFGTMVCAPSSALEGVNEGVKPDEGAELEEEFLRFSEENLVSPLGIEPRTNRLRVCCSTN